MYCAKTALEYFIYECVLSHFNQISSVYVYYLFILEVFFQHSLWGIPEWKVRK